MSAQWPTSVATDSNLYIAVNELQTALSGAITNAVTTIGLNSTTSFPTVGLVLIDNEVIKYTGISGATLTGCTRGFDGTTAASHSSAATVSFAFCADHHNALKDEVKAIETYLSANLGTGATPLTASTALVSNASKKIISSAVTATELGYVSGVTSAIQTQIGTVTTTANAALPKAGGTMSGAIAMGASKITGLANGTAATDAAAFGQIFTGFQAPVQATSTTNFSTTASTFQTTNLSVTITPTSASHRVKITVSGQLQANNPSSGAALLTLAKGATNLGTSTGFCAVQGNSGVIVGAPASIIYIDSPATTAAVTYNVLIRTDVAGQTAQFGLSYTQVIIAEEIV